MSSQTHRPVITMLLALAVAVVVNLILFAALAMLNRHSVVVAEAPPAAVLLPTPPPQPIKVLPVPDTPDETPPPDVPVIELSFELPPPELVLPTIAPSALSLSHIDVSAIGVPVPLIRPHPVRARTEPAPEEEPAVSSRGPMQESDVDQPPRDINTPAPRYPPVAARRGLEGAVTFKLLIDQDGRVEELEIVDVVGHSGFARAVRRAVQNWHFSPAQHAGKAVKVWGLKTVHFKLSD